ncbi:MAG: HepT-like ribonuclease domain-containing protein [Actinomycetota bacterium]
MTPSQPEPEAFAAKLVLLADLLDDLDRLGEVTASHLRADRNLGHVVERVITQLVDIAAGLNSSLTRAPTTAALPVTAIVSSCGQSRGCRTELAARLLPSVGLRNILTNEYGSVDLARVADAVAVARRDYGEYVAQIRDYLLRQAR